MSKPLDPRLLARYAGLRRHLVVAGVVGVLTSVATVVQAYFLARLVVLGFDRAPARAALTPLGWAAGAMTARALLGWVNETAAFRAAADVKARLRCDVLTRVVDDGGRTRSDASDVSSGGVLALLVSGLDALDGYFARFLPQLVLACVVPLVVGAAIAWADLTSAVTVVLVVPLIPLFMVLIGLMTRDRVARRWAVTRSLGHRYADLVGGLPTLQAFGRSRGQTRGLATAQDEYRRETMSALRWAFLSALVLDLVSTLSVALVAVGIGVRLVHGGVGLFAGLFVLLLVPDFFLPVRMVGAHYHDSAQGQAAAAEALDLLELPGPSGTQPSPDLASEALQVSDLVVEYPGRGGPAVGPVSCRIEPGELLVLTGPSGCGKSTLLHTLLGLTDPTAGGISCAGVQLADVDLADWRRQVAWVPQSPRLVGESVAEALRLGCPAASDAQVRSMLDGLGLGNVAPERRLSTDPLSVGEARRLALGRALLRIEVGGATLLLLDEPTASLDAATEDAMVGLLLRVHETQTARGRPFTVVAVSHRATLLTVADRVLELVPPARDTTPGVRLQDGPVRESSLCGVDQVLASSLVGAPTRSESGAGRGVLETAFRSEQGLRRRAACSLALAVLSAGAAVALLLTSGWLISRAAQQPPILYLMVAIVAVRTFGIGRAALRYAERLATHDVALRLLTQVRLTTYRLLDAMPYQRARMLRRGDLVSRLVSDSETVQDLFVRWIAPVVTVGCVTGSLAIVIGLWSLSAAMLLLAAAAVVTLFSWVVVRAVGRTSATAVAPLVGVIAAEALELQAAAPEIAAAGATAQAMRRYRIGVDALAAAERRLAMSRALAGCVVGLGVMVATCGAAWFAISAAHGRSIGATLVAVVVLAPLALQDLWGALPTAFQHRATAAAAAARLGALAGPLARTADVGEPRADIVLGTGVPSIQLHGVSAGWAAGATPLDTLELLLEPGSRTLVRGPSGSGKSTLAAVLTGFLPARSGTMTLDGTASASLSLETIRSRVGLLEQQVHVFDTSIRENLLIARPDASDTDCHAALTTARLEALVASLPDGLDTLVGEYGSALSGGERQRLGVARLLLGGHQVLVLDEPTEHLDVEAERALLDELLSLAPDRTVVLLTHTDVDLSRFDNVVSLSSLVVDPAPGARALHDLGIRG